MLLQIALDMETQEKAIGVLDQVHDLIDIIEAGLVANVEGSKIVKVFKDRYNLPVIWDQKVTDIWDCYPAIDFGADFISLNSETPYDRFANAVKYAHEHNCQVIADFCWETCNAEKMLKFEELGADQISLYPNYDHSKPAADTINLQVAKTVVKRADISVYGSLSVDNMIPVLELKPDILVVGMAIWKAENPREAALAIRELMKKYE